MAKPKKVLRKKGRGRPATGRDPVTAIRLSKELRETVDKWADSQDDQPSRSEAIRRLVELGLKVKAPAKTASKPGRRLRAQELAANAIEKMIDPAAPPEESAQRRRRLTKGPSEFREDRVDLPRAKK
jgi:Arc/MetJ-type ribon-helix-helix transcriptional regulator